MKATVFPLFFLLTLGSTARADDTPPAPKLPLGKDTTYVVGPLDKHGYIDYEAALNEVQGRATQRVWVPKDCPPLAEWLKANERPLALVVEAVKRPAYFNPLVSRRKEGESSNLIGALLPSVQKCREIASALTGRA